MPFTENAGPAGKLSLLLCLALFCVSMPHSALGQQFCSEPVAPYCVTTESEFTTTLQLTRCEEDLSNYEQQVAEYEQCIVEKIQTMRDELAGARKKLEDARENF